MPGSDLLAEVLSHRRCRSGIVAASSNSIRPSRPSQVILIVYQARLQVEAWLRDGETWRHAVQAGPGGEPRPAPALGGGIALAEIYADVPVED